MKLLVIVLCLLSERFLIHHIAEKRFYWFGAYASQILARANHASLWLQCLLLLAPLIIVVGLLVYFLSPLAMGIVAFILHLFIFYYCLGPENPFYPDFEHDTITQNDIGNYLAKVNDQLFAVAFWYLTLGPMGAVLYRAVALCSQQTRVKPVAEKILDVLNWIPARMTAMFYLLVGHFQAGINFFIENFFRMPEYNKHLLQHCGLLALAAPANESIEFTLPRAEKFVEYTIWLFLVIVAFFSCAGFY